VDWYVGVDVLGERTVSVFRAEYGDSRAFVSLTSVIICLLVYTARQHRRTKTQ
jgi:hypothetical protein